MTLLAASPAAPFRVHPSDRDEADRLVREGLLTHLVLDVFLAVGVPVERRSRSAALALALPEALRLARAPVTSAAAVWLWCGGAAPPYLDVVQWPRARAVGGPGVVVHQRCLDAADVQRYGPVAVTTPVRTAAEALCALPPVRALEVLARLVAATDLSRTAVADCVTRMGRSRGVVQARELLDRWPETAPPAGAAHVPAARSVDALARHPVGVEDTLHAADRGDHVVEVGRVGHLEGEPRDRDPVA
jgi:hypothetical protein